MILRVIGSGSSGNCYAFTASDGSILVLEAGMHFSEVQKAIGYKVANIAGCVVSHRHGDHAKYVDEFLKRGISVYALDDVLEQADSAYRVIGKKIVPMHGYRVGSFKVFSFSVLHDVPCVGFVISHPEMGSTLFVTDTMMLEYKFPHLNHIMLEANYADDILEENIENGIVPAAMRGRLLQSHMEIETTKEILRANDLSKVSEVILVHLSGNNSDSALFREEISKACGKPTYIAKKDLQIELNLLPY